MSDLIECQRSVIVACDVADEDKLAELVEATREVSGIGGYKIGLESVLFDGLWGITDEIMDITGLSIIYDHQKGGTDIPEFGQKFARVVGKTSVDAVILFPFGGAKTEREWIKACKDEGLTVLVGGHMTQPEFLESEGGFIADSAPERIYRIAAGLGVTDFVVPGNKPDLVLKYRRILEEELGEGNFVLYAPGFISQGGEITETGKVAGDKWHAIVGSAIYNAGGIEEMRAAAQKLTAQIFKEE